MTAAEIKRIVASAFEVTVADIEGYNRTRHVYLARRCAMWIIRKHKGMSMPAIARLFSNRDHTTVLHALRRAERDLWRYPINQKYMRLLWEIESANEPVFKSKRSAA